MTRPLLTTFLFFCLQVCAQQTVTFKNKDLAATPNWSFLCEQYALGGQCDVQLAKTDTGGLLRLSLPVTSADHYIGGTVYVYLTDNTVITCTDKGLRENDDKRATTWYVFTAKEMARLKKSDIQFIRFVVRGPNRPFSGQTGFFTAHNKVNYYGLFQQEGTNRFPTAEALSQL